MTAQKDDPDFDAAWLAALAGDRSSGLDGVVQRRAALLRKALADRRDRLERSVPVADDALFDRISAAVRSPVNHGAGPLQALDTTPMSADMSADQPMFFRSAPREVSPSEGYSSPQTYPPGRRRFPLILGIAASVLLTAVVTLQLGVFESEDGKREHEILRGGATTTQIVEDPSARATELQQLLQRAGAAPVVQPLKDGRVVLRVAATPEVLEALGQQRILPQTKDGQIVLILEKPATSNSPSR